MAEETVTVSLSSPLAQRLERLSTEHGPGYMDHLLDVCQFITDSDPAASTDRLPIDEWIPKIGIDAFNKSVEIDVGSQVVIVNLADFYKARDAAQLFGQRTEGTAAGEPPAAPAGGPDTAGQQDGGGGGGGAVRFTCGLCHLVRPSQMALRVHGASAHGFRLFVCVRCGLSFLKQRELDRHPCEEERKERERREKARAVPPLLVRPVAKADRVRRLEDTSSSEDSDEDGGGRREEARRRSAPPPPAPTPPRPSPRGRGRPSLAAATGPPRRPPDGKKEAYVCRVCHSKFRDPKSVLNHLKEFHPEHARKAWNKFQENLKSRQPGGSPPRRPSGAGGGRGDEFAVRSVAPMKLKLSLKHGRGRPPAPPHRRPPTSPPAPSSEPAGPPTPGFVTCGVCGGTKYYTHTAQCRLDGSYACEACRKFAGRLQPTQPIQCLLGLGRCHIPQLAPRKAQDQRCRACWLKKCLMAFNMPAGRHDMLRECLPPSIRREVPAASAKPFMPTGRCELDDPDDV